LTRRRLSLAARGARTGFVDAIVVARAVGGATGDHTIAINVNGGTRGCCSTISASASSRARAIRGDSALHRQAPRRAMFFHTTSYQAFLDALRV